MKDIPELLGEYRNGFTGSYTDVALVYGLAKSWNINMTELIGLDNVDMEWSIKSFLSHPMIFGNDILSDLKSKIARKKKGDKSVVLHDFKSVAFYHKQNQKEGSRLYDRDFVDYGAIVYISVEYLLKLVEDFIIKEFLHKL